MIKESAGYDKAALVREGTAMLTFAAETGQGRDAVPETDIVHL